MTTASACVRIALMSSALLLMLCTLAAARRAGLNAEWSRKLAHVGLGLVTLTWPLAFDATWPALVLAALTVIVLVSLRAVPAVKQVAGGAVCGVTRHTSGDLWFPVAAAALFAVTGGDLLLYVVPMATLTFGDAAAALVGRAPGRRRYRVGDTRKSVEGSLSFFAFALVIALVAVAAGSGVPVATLAALVYATVMTLVEAVSTGGSDNLTVPLVGSGLMAVLASGDATVVVAMCVALSSVLVIRNAAARRGTSVA